MTASIIFLFWFPIDYGVDGVIYAIAFETGALCLRALGCKYLLKTSPHEGLIR